MIAHSVRVVSWLNSLQHAQEMPRSSSSAKAQQLLAGGRSCPVMGVLSQLFWQFDLPLKLFWACEFWVWDMVRKRDRSGEQWLFFACLDDG